MNGSKSWDEFMERPRMKRLTQAREAAHEHAKDLPLSASRTNRRESYVAGWLDADGNPAPLTDEKRALTCHCGRIACRHHEGEAMKPITSLSLANIGTQVRIFDDNITLTGVLTAIDAEREVINESVLCVEGGRLTAGAWENITVTVGPNQINLSPSAEWEEA